MQSLFLNDFNFICSSVSLVQFHLLWFSRCGKSIRFGFDSSVFKPDNHVCYSNRPLWGGLIGEKSWQIIKYLMFFCPVFCLFWSFCLINKTGHFACSIFIVYFFCCCSSLSITCTAYFLEGQNKMCHVCISDFISCHIKLSTTA